MNFIYTLIRVKANQRLDNIDFLRAISILFVLFYHYRPFQGGDLFRIGHYGVLLFFMISGYCIHFSAESSSSWLIFLFKRWIRLLPSLVVVSLIILFFKDIFREFNLKDHYLISINDVVKTMVNLPMIDMPIKLINKIIGENYSYYLPDSAFWSLLIEFQFYFVIAIVLIFPKKWQFYAQLIILGLFTYVQVCKVIRYNVFYELAYFYPYFLIGISLAYKNFRRQIVTFFASLFCIAFMQYFNVYNNSIPFEIIPTLAVLLLFVFTIYKSTAFLLLGRFFSIIGLISYPLYLLHQHLGQKMLNIMGHYQDPSIFNVLLVIGVLMFVSWSIYEFIEVPIQNKLKSWLK